MCPHVDTSCKAANICRTCGVTLRPSTKDPLQFVCREIDQYPNATVDEFGAIRLDDNQGDIPLTVHQIKAEIFARGPVAAAVNGKALHKYRGGIFNDTAADRNTTHVVSIIGWGVESDVPYWTIRNSWGEYWGENLGRARIAMGSNMLGIESDVAWATPGVYSTQNFPCWSSGKNCGPRPP